MMDEEDARALFLAPNPRMGVSATAKHREDALEYARSRGMNVDDERLIASLADMRRRGIVLADLDAPSDTVRASLPSGVLSDATLKRRGLWSGATICPHDHRAF